MKFLLSLLSFLLISLLPLHAKQVDLTTAKIAGSNFIYYKTDSPNLNQGEELKLIYTSASSDGSTIYFYVFNFNNGFVIVSGDDCVLPVLGYSNEKEFRVKPMVSSMTKWLENYKAQIRYAIVNHLPATTEITNSWEELKGNNGTIHPSTSRNSVDPLLQTTWDQPSPYNALCPGGSVTGCVATAMAQIMKYWNYPATGQGFHSFNHNNYGTLSANFGSTTYQWGSMPNSISSSNNAIATLMYHCGISVDMEYSPESSGAWVIENSPTPEANSEYAFKNYFSYDNSLHGIQRENYSDAQWENLLKTELNASRPILYDGFGNGGGHCFVNDGYDNNDFFHFNWGWSGYYNGYFESSALNPGGTGTGGGTGGYNNNQEVVIGIKPPAGGGTGGSALELYDDLQASSGTIYYGNAFEVTTNIWNNSTANFSGDYGAGVFDAELNFVDFIEIKTGWSLSAGNVYIDGITFATNGLFSMLPGDYYVAVFSREAGGDWSIVGNGGYENLLEITVINSNDIELYSDMEVYPGTTLTQGEAASVNLNILNDGISTFTGTYSVDLYDLNGTWVEAIGEINEPNGLPAGYLYLDPFLTFSTNAIGAEPGTYLLALTHLRSGGNWELTGSSYFQNPVTVTVKAASLLPDVFENNNTAGQAYTLSLNFSGNAANKNTTGSNCHVGTDYDFYKINLPQGFDYTIDARLHDSYDSGNGNTYTLDGQFSYSFDGTNWSDVYDDILPEDIIVYNGGTLYFFEAPYFPGQTGSYLLDLHITRSATTATNELDAEQNIQIYPNPATDIVHIDLSDADKKFEHIKLVNLLGQVVAYQAIDDQEMIDVPVRDYTAGMYSLILESRDGIVSKKIIIGR
ncbi:MAG TPA: thiol protease/hemagglutinin PrtT [Saprospiraceae bacterium]|nr:thiol protease/hemagglutinin PrtT [Saprospiraceae bacterium]